MSKGNITENDVVKFLFNNVAMPAYGSNLYLALHTADPGEAGDQTTAECAYLNYARVSVSRDAGGWVVSGNQSQNATLLQFPVSGDGPEVATHLSIGTAANGAGQIIASGALSASLTINNLIQPQFAISGITYQED